MLTSTFLQKEPVTVLTPSSVSEQKVPTANLASILVSPEGKVFISIAGDADAETKDTWGTEALRKTILDEAVTLYNKQNPSKAIQLTAQDREAFSKINMFGVPFQSFTSSSPCLRPIRTSISLT